VDNEEPRRAPFDQRAALEELERLRQGIARYRAQREALGEEFDSFLRSLKTPPERTAGPAPSASLPASTDSPSPSSADRSDAADRPAVVPLDALPAPVARARAMSPTPALLGGALIVILAAGLLARSRWKPAPESPPPSGGSDAHVAAPAPAPAPAPAAAEVPSSESAITTVRRVWMRVIVDGERVLEREVPAGTRVPLNAEKTIVIRTGDAGAVRLAIRGEERGLLGVEGEVVTRSFAVPPRRAPAGR
jgi:hypothetical protein